MTIPLFDKHRPKKFSEIKGQDLAVAKVKSYLLAFRTNTLKKKAVLLHGPTGTGKTTLAMVAALENDSELFELNASDLRNRTKLDEILKPSSQQKSLFGKGKIILVDEVDGVTSTDYGGLAELITLLEKSKFPMIITCNDVWQNKFSLLRTKCEMVPMKEIDYFTIMELLADIIKKENKFVPDTIIKEIGAKSRGDLRAALNDLQSIIHTETPAEASIDVREKATDIFNALKRIFKLRTNNETINAYDNVDLELDQIFLWLEENIPTEYRGEDLQKAFEALSIADVYRGRIHRQQHWHFLTYENFFLSVGVSAAKGYKNLPERFTKYNPPQRILKIWMANQKNAKKKAIAGKLAEFIHTSKRTALKDFPILCLIIDKDTEKLLDLTEPEQEFLEEYRGAIKVSNNLNRFKI